ncbi:uncharacterized protein EV422DRAFT_515537 [Fimicolochytrium jonesii]|uniref:uncharacterized protein n=1 Tax=Fimicolochytrium jonesii TaxID=1396493 RepID=UPI0022FE854E|nr:uncharacterized protein EV422DRAFT_515537 [Fimicolochytrium jonesii]KAI8826152.1 hypothetical protein EV422DRAFT_515537 [Fimicolochytrium jonesii]
MDKTVGGTPKKSPKRTVAPPTPLSKQKPAPKRRPSCGRSASHAASPSVRPLPKVTLTVYPASSRSPSPAPQCSIRETRSETPVVPDELGSQIEPLRSETHRSSSMESHGSERESTASASNSTAVASGQQPGAVTSSFERAMHCIRVPMRMSQSAYDENILRGLWYGHCYAADFLAVSPHIRQAALLWYRYVQAHYPELNQDVSAIAGETDPAFWNDTDQIDLCHRLLKVDPIAQPDDMKEMNAVQSALLHRSMQPYRDSHAPLDIPTVYAVSSAMITSGQASPFLGWASSPPHRAELGHMEFGGTPALQHLHPENRTHGSDATTTPRIRASSATPPHVRRGMSNDSQDRREVTFSDNLDHYWFALDNVPYSSLNISDH